jgi:hypothetical protein
LSERLAGVQRQLEDLSEATRSEWLRAAHQSFLTIEGRSAFRVTFDASSDRFLELLEDGYRTRNTCRANVLGTSTKPAYWSWISPRRGGQDPLRTTGSTRMPPALEGKEPTLFCVRVGSPASTRSLSKRGPHSQAHLTMTSVASVYPDSCVASFRKDLDGRNVHFFAALAGRAFSAAGHQQALELRH